MKKLLIVEDDKNWADILGKFAADVGAKHRVVVSGGPLGVKAVLNKTSMRPNEARAIFREVLNDGAE